MVRHFVFQDELKIIDLARHGGAEFNLAERQAIDQGIAMGGGLVWLKLTREPAELNVVGTSEAATSRLSEVQLREPNEHLSAEAYARPGQEYYAALARFHRDSHDTEGNTRSAFAHVLKKCASPYDWLLVEE